jgi:hypothetical protein
MAPSNFKATNITSKNSYPNRKLHCQSRSECSNFPQVKRSIFSIEGDSAMSSSSYIITYSSSYHDKWELNTKENQENSREFSVLH